MGDEAGDVITTGSNNTIIGYGADPSANDASNQIVIGKRELQDKEIIML